MLPRLNSDPQVLVDVQQTEFSHDVLGRWACSTWSEVRDNGGDPFDIVVVGAGTELEDRVDDHRRSHECPQLVRGAL